MSRKSCSVILELLIQTDRQIGITKVIYTFYSVLRVGFAKNVWTEKPGSAVLLPECKRN